MAAGGVPALTGMLPDNSYIPNNSSAYGGGTYTNPKSLKDIPTLADYENIFGPAARDIKEDTQRNRRHARWHLPDALKGPNPYLTDRIDGLITDTTTSPFTTVILPYQYTENVDAKIKWNVWSFDEGLSSRVPYESAARTLTQTKRSYAGYMVRQGLAITMEHNFMMSAKGRENFKHQVQQIIGSIQNTNDIDVQVALITAPSYAKTVAEKYYASNKTSLQVIREYIDLFGFMQKNPNAMDIMIEEARNTVKTWGSKEPNFLLVNPKLTFQMTMIPDVTQYITQGPDGVKRLKNGPNIGSYRGLKIIPTKSASLENGAPPRDVLSRRIRVAEYYLVQRPRNVDPRDFWVEMYDEGKDAFERIGFNDLLQKARLPTNLLTVTIGGQQFHFSHVYNQSLDNLGQTWTNITTLLERGNFIDNVTKIQLDQWGGVAYWTQHGAVQNNDGQQYLSGAITLSQNFNQPPPVRPRPVPDVDNPFFQNLLAQYTDANGAPLTITARQIVAHAFCYAFQCSYADQTGVDWCMQDDTVLIIRPNIEHNMLGIVMGRGGLDDLGATLWGQTELSCFDDSMHGIWGMSYKYHERAIVFNERNLIRLWDVAYDGYNGGKDLTHVDWTVPEEIQSFNDLTHDLSVPYEGQSMMVMSFRTGGQSMTLPSPILFGRRDNNNMTKMAVGAELLHEIDTAKYNILGTANGIGFKYYDYVRLMPRFDRLHMLQQPGNAAHNNETTHFTMAFQGTYKVGSDRPDAVNANRQFSGNGHHAVDYVGAASVRAGKGSKVPIRTLELK